ncbi:DEAD/DEAH box helicase [Frankia sp. QA3]|uniref:DEAD/DEAH box helicase n=1 Tax=Frankia sp. QA3 TaxID=710111 RepID=UPI000269C137|nr:AAA domain-containing protein [Frankia sp. QA3]EIV92913.1 hypothetical protein FraQA3DRAFT_2581 [Frankia sp. QA3]
MTSQPITLPGPLAVIPAQRAVEQLDGRPDLLIGEFAELSGRGALPARIEPDRRDPARGKLVVYARRHVASLYPTKMMDGYRLGHVGRRTFRDEDRLTTAAMLLHCPAGWHAFHDLRDLPRGDRYSQRRWSTQWVELSQAWAALSALAEPQPPESTVAPHHQRYLDLVGRIIDASRDIEVAKQESAPPLPYARREATREQRFSGRGVYAFHLARPGEVAASALVHIADQPELRGRVERVNGREVVVRFDQAVDFNRIPPQGELRVLPSDRIYRIQQAAADTLARGEAANPALLANLVDGVVLPYQPDPVARPRGPLKGNQIAAFSRALAVPDLLLVLGPPGTGKTTTITEIVLACVERGQKVLVSSHTNRAVDNVLENLPSDVGVVRVGSESSMTSAARARTVDSQIEGVRRDILADTALLDRLAAFEGDRPTLERWLDYLADRRSTAAEAQAQARVVGESLDLAVEALSPELVTARRHADDDHGRRQATCVRLDESLAAAYAELPAREAAADTAGALQWWRRWRLTRLRRRFETTLARRAAAQAELARAAATVDDLRAQAAAVAANDPHCQGLIAERDRLATAAAEAMGAVVQAAQVITSALRPLLPVPDSGPGPDGDAMADWDRFHTWATMAVETLRSRGALLTEWRSRIGDAESELRHELVRYADVVAATCVGTASSQLLTDIVFDLAIIDEAGQISTPNLLVPMVRARRSVLVGDHYQLPPFLDDDVRHWSEQLVKGNELPPAEAQEIGELLRASGFEHLFPRIGEDHRIELTLQRRMPEELARFVSRAFYQGRLRTEHPGGGGDPVFRSPFAMVDTSDRPEAERAERPLHATEPWQQRGYVNELEVELIAAVVARLAGTYRDWAVIVPYRAQARRIEAALGRELGDPARVAENVGTVDSFQGGERELIVYGFTRSNGRGAVGFLKELRRLNVAITRAKRQLVLVGDTATLRSAGDEAFAEMARGLTDYLRSDGDLRASIDLERQLRSGP